jgi:1-acyl-sn-glycerol-3-phosphate acyltransferase
MALLALMFLGFPPIFVVINLWPRHTAWGFIQRIFRLTLWLAGVRVQQHGIEKIDPTAPVIMMGNHVNWLDHIILATILPTPLVGFEKTENFRIPIYGPMMRRWGNVKVSRRSDPQEALRAAQDAAKILAQKCWFLVFPEGTRTRSGTLGTFKKGGFHVAIDANALIVPFAFQGAWEVMATGRWWAMPGTVHVYFGSPVDAADYGKAGLENLMQVTRHDILRLGGQPEAASAPVLT